MSTAYDNAIHRLDEFSNFEKKAHILKPAFSLDGITAILRRLGNPHKKYNSVHVAGTVGKGSVCFMLDSALRASGHKTGLYISPHIADLRERIRVGGKMISKTDFARVFDIIVDKGKADPHEHTYFEAITAMAFQYFAEQGVEIAIIETGLGGRLDSTNVVPPFMSVITRVGLDHTAVLGATLPEIAAEKAGIVKPRSHLVTLKQHESVNRVMEEKCASQKVRLHWADRDKSDLLADALGERFSTGFYRENLSIVLSAIDALEGMGVSINRKRLTGAIKKTEFPGRMEWREIATAKGIVKVVVDAAHNPPAARTLAKELDALGVEKKNLILVIAMMRDKDSAGFMKAMAPKAKAVICSDVEYARAWPSADLAKRAGKYCAAASAAPDVTSALDAALAKAKPGDMICLTGSFYAIESGKQWLDKFNSK